MMKWVGNEVRFGEMEYAYKIIIEKPEGKSPGCRRYEVIQVDLNLLKPKFVYKTFKISFHTAKKTQLFGIRKISWLKLFKEIIHTKSINTK
jgi:hypothetical protein